jgi:hypothetical protein
MRVRPITMPGQASQAANVRLEHRNPNGHGPRTREEVAEALPYRDAEVGVERLEDNHGRLARRLAGCGIVVRPRQGRDEEGPAGKAEELDEGREDADHGRGGDNGSAVAGPALARGGRRAARVRRQSA